MKKNIFELQCQTIGACFAERVKKTPDKVAVTYEGKQMTWREIDVLSDWLVHRFAFLGMKKGSRAAIWCGNCLQWVIVYIGLQKIGALTILINPGYQEEELYNVLSYAQIEYLFYGENFKGVYLPDIINKIDLQRNPELKQIIPIEDLRAVAFMEDGAKRLTEEQKEQIAQLKEKVIPEESACMLFTSGTTAMPKGVLLSHLNLVNDARMTAAAMHWDETDRICVMVPLFHCFGMTSCLLASILSGCSVYLMKHYRTATALAAIEAEGCTVLNGVPSMFLAMIHNRALSDYRIDTLKSGIIAGSPISSSEYRNICEKLQMQKLQMSYGQTETSPGISFSKYEESIAEKCDNAGYIIPGIETCIWTKDGVQHIYSETQLAGGEETHTPWKLIGEIGVKGFPVMKGYYNRPEETARALTADGWLHTGDVGYFDTQGRLHIEGRMKEMIIRGGENISPKEIEECMKRLPEVREVKVLGIPQKILQEEIAAAIVLKKNATLNKQQVQEFVGVHLAPYKVPKEVLFLEELPVNSSGKIKTGELREWIIAHVNQETN